MRVLDTELAGVKLIEPVVRRDDRGRFLETWQSERFAAAGIDITFRQDNVSVSRRGVLRGLHCQHPGSQAKLVTVLSGRVFDAVVDARVGSPQFGHWMGVELGAEDHRQLLVPAGFLHGFVALTDDTIFAYKCSTPYVANAELCVRWDDPGIGITWPITDPELSTKDAGAPRLAELDPDRLPRYGPPGGA